jgi:hypothetical protein
MEIGDNSDAISPENNIEREVETPLFYFFTYLLVFKIKIITVLLCIALEMETHHESKKIYK